jgi:hypothetical protein
LFKRIHEKDSKGFATVNPEISEILQFSCQMEQATMKAIDGREVRVFGDEAHYRQPPGFTMVLGMTPAAVNFSMAHVGT